MVFCVILQDPIEYVDLFFDTALMVSVAIKNLVLAFYLELGIFQESLMSHEGDFANGCNSFDYGITSNGLCHIFNGFGTLDLFKQKWMSTELVKAFGSIFETFVKRTNKFRGVGHSEGKNKLY